MRVLYTWRVKIGQEQKFLKAWKQGTKTIRSKCKGAQGSMLLRSQKDSGKFIAVASWEYTQDWTAHNRSGTADPEALKAMREAATFVSAESFHCVADLTDARNPTS